MTVARIWTPNPIRPTFVMPRQHGADVEIGRRVGHGGKVWPHARSEKWAGECWLEIAAKGVEPRPGKPERVTDDTIEIDCGRKAARGKAKGETHRFKSGPLKWEVVYGEASDLPDEGYVAFDLSNPPGLEWHYQPALTPAEIARGDVRPDDVIGSYAAYWPQLGRILRPDGTERINYETGKYCHIYRPEWVAANGERLWGAQAIVDTELRIAIPAAWIQSLGLSAFPLVLDPTIGYTSVGGSQTSFNASYLYATGPYTAAEAGEASSVSWYNAVASTVWATTFGVYTGASAPDSLLRDSAESTVSGVGWMTVNLDSAASFSLGDVLWPACGSRSISGWQARYDTVSGYTFHYKTSGGATPGVLPSTFGTGSTYENRRYSAYITYTAAAVPGGIPLHARRFNRTLLRM